MCLLGMLYLILLKKLFVYFFFVLLKMTEEKTFKEKMIEYNKIMGSLS